MEPVEASAVDNHHGLADGSELSGEGDSMAGTGGTETGGLALARVRRASLH